MSASLHLVNPQVSVASGVGVGGGGRVGQPAPVSVDDLKRAWAELSGGTPSPSWQPVSAEQVIPVLASVGSAGASLLALAIAEASEVPTRVVECCPRSASGVAGASDIDLGEHGAGWLRAMRGGVLVERAGCDAWNPTDLAQPPPFPLDNGSRTNGAATVAALDAAPDDVSTAAVLSVLDIGWRAGQLLSSGSWLPTAVCSADAVVVVSPASEPGLRRLEATLRDLGPDRVVAAVVGPRLRRWSPRLRGAAQHLTRDLLATGRAVAVPVDPVLAIRGITEAALPPRVLAAGREVLDALHQVTCGATAGDAS